MFIDDLKKKRNNLLISQKSKSSMKSSFEKVCFCPVQLTVAVKRLKNLHYFKISFFSQDFKSTKMLKTQGLCQLSGSLHTIGSEII